MTLAIRAESLAIRAKALAIRAEYRMDYDSEKNGCYRVSNNPLLTRSDRKALNKLHMKSVDHGREQMRGKNRGSLDSVLLI
jgi:hypothetical protein